MINYIKQLWRLLVWYQSKPVNGKWKVVNYNDEDVVKFTNLKSFNNAVYGRDVNDKRTYVLEDSCEAFDNYLNKK